MKTFEEHILALCSKKEGYVIEFKAAKGGLPGSLWESYSAFANTAGGIIVLGIKEKDNVFYPDGLDHDTILRYKKYFWDGAHNPQKVSSCLLKEEDVIEDRYRDGSYLLIIKVPRAAYDAKPVYINGNPKYTFRRNHEGDYICTQSEISRMYAEAPELKEHFGANDDRVELTLLLGGGGERENDKENDKVKPLQLTDRQQKILSVIRLNDKVTAKEIKQYFSESLSTINREITVLKGKGLLSREGSDKKGRWKVLE